MIKQTALVLLCAALYSCDSGKYFFSQRIGHDREQVASAQEEVLTKPEAKQPGIKTQAKALTVDSSRVIRVERVPAPRQEVPVKLQEAAPLEETGGMEQTAVPAIVKKTNAFNNAERNRPVVAASADISGFGIFMLVMAGIAVLTFLISLLLGFTVGQAALYALIALVIVIVAIIWLLMLMGGSGSSGSSSDDDENESPEDN